MPDPLLPNLPINAETLIEEARAARERKAEEHRPSRLPRTYLVSCPKQVLAHKRGVMEAAPAAFRVIPASGQSPEGPQRVKPGKSISFRNVVFPA